MNIFYLFSIVFVILFVLIIFLLFKKYKGRYSHKLLVEVYPAVVFPVILYVLLIILIPSVLPYNTIDSGWFIGLVYEVYDRYQIGYYISSTLLTTIALGSISIGILDNNSFKKNKSIPLFEGFVNDASTLHIFGKNLNFLSKSKYQEKVIKKLGKKCKIICAKPESSEIKQVYRGLMDSGCQLRVIDEVDYRGQIKLDSSQNYKACVVEKRLSNYVVLDMQSDSIVNVLLDKVNELYESGYSPFPKVIVLDVGGVYFNGDYHLDFCNVLKEKFDIKLTKRRSDKVLLDRKLNLGKTDIIGFIETQVKYKLTKETAEKIRDIWSNVWSPNETMMKLVSELKRSGYRICFFSNIDSDNGEVYDTKGYFPSDTMQYFSYWTEFLIPDEDAFINIMEKENVKGEEIVYIDDQMTNLEKAKEFKWRTIHYLNSEQDKFENLLNKLRDEDVEIEYEIFK